MLRGRCADCGKAFSPRYFWVELAFGFLGWLVLARFGSNEAAWVGLLFFWAALLVAWVDWLTQYIYDVVSYPLLALGVSLNWLAPWFFDFDFEPLLAALFMGLVMVSVQALGKRMAGRDALGGGDVKYMAAAAAFLGWNQSFSGLVLGFLLGLPIMLLYLRVNRLSRKDPAPLGPGLALGCSLALWNKLSYLVYGAGDLDPWLDRVWLDLLKVGP